MFNTSHYLLFLSIMLIITDIGWCIYIMFAKRDVLLKNEGQRLWQTALVITILIAVFFFHTYIYTHKKVILSISWILLAGSLIFTFLFRWFFNQLMGARERTHEILETVLCIIETRDPNLEGHSLYVKQLTMLLYEALPFRYRMRLNPENLQYAALLLDIGKLGIPNSIINKSGKLTEKELESISRHTEFGETILRSVPSFDKISLWIKYHHERIDGTGYYHLKDREIPFESRLIAVADTFSALTMDKNYRPTLSYIEAINELKLSSGLQLDPELVDYFCNIPLNKIEASRNSVKAKIQQFHKLFVSES